MALYTYKHVREKADELIEKFGYSEPPVDVRSIAMGLGIKIVELSLPFWFSGGLVLLDGQYYIALNKGLTSTQKMLTIAHEIAHHQMEHHDMSYSKNSRTPFCHVEADVFAQELCMPSVLVRREAGRWFKDHRFLARLFGVDEKAMIQRMEELELLPRRRYVWDNSFG